VRVTARASAPTSAHASLLVTRAGNVIAASKKYASPTSAADVAQLFAVQPGDALLACSSKFFFRTAACDSLPDQCVARKVPELCKAYTPGKSDQDIPARVARLESIIESAFPHLSGYPNTPSADPLSAMPGSGSVVDEDSDSSPDERQASDGRVYQGGRFEGGRWYGDTVSTSIAPTAVLEQVRLTYAAMRVSGF
jgi:hypothetical protein